MYRYIATRVGQSALLLVLVVSLSFLFIRLAPGDSVTYLYGSQQLSAEVARSIGPGRGSTRPDIRDRRGATHGATDRRSGVVVPGSLRSIDARVDARGVGQAILDDGADEGVAGATRRLPPCPAQCGQADLDDPGPPVGHDAGRRRHDGGRLCMAGHGSSTVHG